jgi:hypothetical protein
MRPNHMTADTPHTSRKRRSHTDRSRAWLLWSAVLACIVAALVVSMLMPSGREQTPEMNAASPERVALDDTLSDDIDAATRTVYRHSVVAGGVHSQYELRNAIAMDAVVAAHYTNVTVSDARMEKVREPRLAYMSYRIGDRIYWTKHKMALQVGEAILTDGRNEIRARCGNCISDKPMQPTLLAEPAAAEFDRATVVPSTEVMPSGAPTAPEFTLAAIPEGFGGDPGGLVVGGFPALGSSTPPPGLIPPGGGPTPIGDPDPDPGLDPDPEPGPGPGPNPGDDPPPVVPVPEPGSLILVGTGIAAFAIGRLRARRSQGVS